MTLDDFYPEWHKDAACLSMDSTYFFGPNEERRSMSPKQIRQAREVCHSCPVFEECLTHALEHNELYGVWAGTSGRERKGLQALIQGGESIKAIVECYLSRRDDERTRSSA